MSTPSTPPQPPKSERYVVPLPVPYIHPPPMTDEMRARGIARIDEMLAHLDDPLPEGEVEWDVDELFPLDRAR